MKRLDKLQFDERFIIITDKTGCKWVDKKISKSLHYSQGNVPSPGCIALTATADVSVATELTK